MSEECDATKSKQIFSLFCGCGGLDLGFEAAGFQTALAYDRRPDAISSWNRNREKKVAKIQDISNLDVAKIDEDFGGRFTPIGVIGGPPCQGFSLANRNGGKNDPRNLLVDKFIDVALILHERSKLDFIVMENVPQIIGTRGDGKIDEIKCRLEAAGFYVSGEIIDAQFYGVPQRRRRYFLVALQKSIAHSAWTAPETELKTLSVRDAIGGLPEPTYFSRSANPTQNPSHENHWCMVPKSIKFSDGSLKEGYSELRSFKTLSWDKPSFTASYGNREVHVHPSGRRRLSVYEAMLIQGFPRHFVLNGSLSSQVTQVSEAVPPPLAKAVADSIEKAIRPALKD